MGLILCPYELDKNGENDGTYPVQYLRIISRSNFPKKMFDNLFMAINLFGIGEDL